MAFFFTVTNFLLSFKANKVDKQFEDWHHQSPPHHHHCFLICPALKFFCLRNSELFLRVCPFHVLSHCRGRKNLGRRVALIPEQLLRVESCYPESVWFFCLCPSECVPHSFWWVLTIVPYSDVLWLDGMVLSLVAVFSLFPFLLSKHLSKWMSTKNIVSVFGLGNRNVPNSNPLILSKFVLPQVETLPIWNGEVNRF